MNKDDLRMAVENLPLVQHWLGGGKIARNFNNYRGTFLNVSVTDKPIYSSFVNSFPTNCPRCGINEKSFTCPVIKEAIDGPVCMDEPRCEIRPKAQDIVPRSKSHVRLKKPHPEEAKQAMRVLIRWLDTQ